MIVVLLRVSAAFLCDLSGSGFLYKRRNNLKPPSTARLLGIFLPPVRFSKQNVVDEASASHKGGHGNQRTLSDIGKRIQGLRVYDLEVIQANGIFPGKFLTSRSDQLVRSPFS